MTQYIYQNHADAILQIGLNPIPVRKGQKNAVNRKWNKDASELPSLEYVQELKQKYGDCNIGVANGTKLPNGRLFAALDIDVDGFVPFIKMIMQKHISGKFGSKGLTIFCQADPELKSGKFKAKGRKSHGVELMINSGMVVIPPSIHPNGNQYIWDVKSLHDISLDELPVLDAATHALMKHVMTNTHAWGIVEGGANVHGHELMLSLTSSGIASMVDNLPWLAECLNALFHPEYTGNTEVLPIN
jgi:hypothetical protein